MPARRRPIRRYQAVTDRVARRIYKLDRWRIPLPSGLPAISLAYLVGWVAAIAVLSKLPLVGRFVELLPPSFVWVAIPLVGSWALTTLRVDGRAPHRALVALCMWRLRPRTVVAGRRCPEVGSTVVPIAGLAIAPSGDEPRYRAGRVRGPAVLTLRYPAELCVERRRRTRLRAWRRRTAADVEDSRQTGELEATRLRVRGVAGDAPLRRGAELRVPAGGEVVFE